MSEFDYVKIGQADAPEPFSLEDLFGLMSDLDTNEDAPFIGVIYGDPGSRKSTRALEIAQKIIQPGQKVLYVHTGQGYSVFKNHPELQFGSDGKRNVKRMPFIRYEQIETLRAVLMNPEWRAKLNFGAVVFDEYNRMQDMDTDSLTKHRAGLLNSGPKQFDKKGVQLYKDPNTPEWPEYNTTKLRLIELLNDCFQVPDTHFLFVCHARFQKANVRREPDFPEKSAAALLGLVHSVYYCDKVDTPTGTSYPIILEGSEGLVAKNRIGGLPSVIYDTDKIVDAYKAWGIIPESIQPVSETDVANETELLAELESPVVHEPEAEQSVTNAVQPQEIPANNDVDLTSLFG